MPRRPPSALFKSGWILATGLMLGLSFPPFGLYPLGWVALVPLLIRWAQRPAFWVAFRESYAALLIAFALPGYWMLFHESTAVTTVAALSLIVAPAPLSLAVAGSINLSSKLGQGVGFTALVSFWMFGERVLVYGPFALPWFLLGHSQATALPFNQFADVLGVSGLGLWVWFVNGAGLIVYQALSGFAARVYPRPYGHLAAGGALFAGLLAVTAWYGTWRLPQIQADDTLMVAVVQPGLSADAWNEASASTISSQLRGLSDDIGHRGHGLPFLDQDPNQAHPIGVDLVVWPEGALSGTTEDVPTSPFRDLARWCRTRDVSLVTGAVLPNPDNTSQLLSAAVVLDADSALTPVFPIWTSSLSAPDALLRPSWALTEAAGVFGRPSRDFRLRARPVLTQGRRIAPLVGFESLFAERARWQSASGAELLVAVADHGWWGESMGPRQHLALTRLRAIENRRAVVLAAENGPSAIILPTGEVASRLEQGDTGSIQAEVPLVTSSTPFLFLGDAVGLASVPFTGLLLLFGWIARLSGRSSKVGAPASRRRPTWAL